MQVLLDRWLIQCQFHSKTLCSNFWIIHVEAWVARTDKDAVCHFRQNRNLCKAASFMKQTWTVTRLERKDKKRDYGVYAFCLLIILNSWIHMTTESLTNLQRVLYIHSLKKLDKCFSRCNDQSLSMNSPITLNIIWTDLIGFDCQLPLECKLHEDMELCLCFIIIIFFNYYHTPTLRTVPGTK